MSRTDIKYIFSNTMLTALCLTMMALSGCLKDTEEFIPNQENVQASAFGVVLNEQDLPVNTTIVELEGESVVTDSNGVFIFSNVVVPANLATISFSALGYFQTFKSFIPDAESIPSLTIKLQEKGANYTLDSRFASRTTTDEDIIMDAQANSWFLNGGSYQGELNINTSYLNPLDDNIFAQIPGEPLAKNADDDLGMLIHYGTVFIEMNTSSNEKLTLDPSNGLLIKMPVPTDLQASSPTSTEFWKLDPLTNQWILQGQAVLVNGYYEAKIYEGGVYSVQQFKEYVKVSGNVITPGGDEVENILLTIGMDNSPIKRKLWTNKNGNFKTFAPLRESLIVTLENECFETLDQFRAGPLLSTTELEDIEIDPGSDYRKIQGQLLQCAGTTNGVADGYSFIKTENHNWIIPVGQDGFFTLQLFICPNHFTISGVDLENDLSASITSITELDSKPRTITVGVLKACD